MSKDIYTDGSYLENNPGWHQGESSWKANEVMAAINKNRLVASSICEVGCGRGKILELLSEQLDGNINYTGYDISPQAIELCSNISCNNIKFHLKDLTEDDEASFDILLILDVVEHVEDYYGFLRKIKDKARYKIFHIPICFTVRGVLAMSELIKDRDKVGHIHCFSKEIALASLEYVGYKILDYSYIGKRVEVEKGWKAKLAKYPRKLLSAINQDLGPKLLGGYSLSVVAE